MNVKPAKGTKGHLLDMFNGTYCFRVYNTDGTFTDYDLRHCDLTVTIEDEDACFYSKGENHRLDHAPLTLGEAE